MAPGQVVNELQIVAVERLQIHQFRVAPALELAARIQHVGDAAAHAGGEVPSRPPEDDHASARHVLAAVIADALDNGGGSGISDGEALAGDTADERLSTRRAIQRDVAGNHVVLRGERRATRRREDDPPARQSLTDAVVGIAFESERDAAWHERAKA